MRGRAYPAAVSGSRRAAPPPCRHTARAGPQARCRHRRCQCAGRPACSQNDPWPTDPSKHGADSDDHDDIRDHLAEQKLLDAVDCRSIDLDTTCRRLFDRLCCIDAQRWARSCMRPADGGNSAFAVGEICHGPSCPFACSPRRARRPARQDAAALSPFPWLRCSAAWRLAVPPAAPTAALPMPSGCVASALRCSSSSRCSTTRRRRRWAWAPTAA